MPDMTAEDVRRALLARYPASDWLRAFEVPDVAGAQPSRYCDAMFVHRDPSRGDLVGIEIKVSRGDMRRELADPAKAATFSSRVHDWYVAAPVGVLSGSDVPPRWGWLTIAEDGSVRQERVPHRNESPAVWAHSWRLAFTGAVQRTATYFAPLGQPQASEVSAPPPDYSAELLAAGREIARLTAALELLQGQLYDAIGSDTR